MTKYLIKMTLTTQGWAGLVEKPQNRFDAVRPVFEATGSKLLDYWFAVDKGAIYALMEAPETAENTSNALAMEMAVLSGGTIASVDVTRLLGAAEVVESMKKAKSLGYRPAASMTPAKK